MPILKFYTLDAREHKTWRNVLKLSLQRNIIWFSVIFFKIKWLQWCLWFCVCWCKMCLELKFYLKKKIKNWYKYARFCVECCLCTIVLLSIFFAFGRAHLLLFWEWQYTFFITQFYQCRKQCHLHLYFLKLFQFWVSFFKNAHRDLQFEMCVLKI